MRRITTLVAAALVASAAFAAPAHAAPEPYGTLCGGAFHTDAQVPGSYTGAVAGGPLVLADDTDLSIYGGTLTCTIQVFNAPTHAGGDACAVTGAPGLGAVTAAGTCTFAATLADEVYVCTSVAIDGGPTLYYDAPNDLLAGDVSQGGWTTDPNASCAVAHSAGGLDCSHTQYPCNGILLLVCPVLAVVFPPHGDLPGLADCAPYGDEGNLRGDVVYLAPGYHLLRRI